MSKVLFFKSRSFLAYLWVVGSVALIVLAISFHVIGDRYGNRDGEVWEWLLPSFMPTLTLIISVLVTDNQNDSSTSTVSKTLFHITAGCASVYLLLLFCLLLFPQAGNEVDSIDKLKQTSIYLGPLQGIVSAAYGAFFISRSSQSSEKEQQLEDLNK